MAGYASSDLAFKLQSHHQLSERVIQVQAKR
jgi:hypothetical protein